VRCFLICGTDDSEYFRYPYDVLRPLKQSLGWLTAIVAIGVWQAYVAFDRFFASTAQEMNTRNYELWFLTGPIALFLGSASGWLFALVASMTKHPIGKRFWSALLWIPTVCLSVGALVFWWLDWFGRGLHSSLPDRIWYWFIVVLPMFSAAFLLWRASAAVRRTENLSMPELSVGWKRAAATGARIAAWLGLAAGSLLVVFASALALLMVSCNPPSLATLARRFPSERRDLEEIVRMSDEDSTLSVIDPGWLQVRNGPQFLTFDPKSGITEARWNEYRRIFRNNDITQGIRRYQPDGDAFIIVKSVGLLDNGYSNGYLYCSNGPEHSYPPCSSKDDRGSHPQTDGGEAYSFIRLSDRWYAFSDGPG
jgi:hypothetical protein